LSFLREGGRQLHIYGARVDFGRSCSEAGRRHRLVVVYGYRLG
jgi:hypothetical protein